VTTDPSASTPPPASPKAGRPIFGDYQVEGELGRGGMGVVFRARQKGLNRLVALKMLTGHYGPDEIARFRAEAETAASLHHTNIVQIYEVGEDDGAPFFSMEYIETGSLADRLRGAVLPPREAAQLLISVARALHFAHQNGVVHRDMKPANVLLDPDGVPKVTDFGIAKRLTGNASLTLTGAVIGTPTYMAPEQAKGTSRDVGAAADIYSLGAILYEMLAGRPPFLPEESETALTVRVITEDPVSPAWHRPGISRDLETICLKCLEKEPRDRYPSAAAFAEDLRRFLDDESIVARPPTTVVRTVKWIRRHPWHSVAAIALLLALAAAGQQLWRWEFYQRLHVEYAARVDYVRGVLEPVLRLSSGSASHRAAHLRLTRQGRWGPITLVEVLNPRGNPAVLRAALNDELIPIYIEGLTRAHPYSEKAPESATVEFAYEGERVLEATSRDRNGKVNWRVLYDRPAPSAPANTARARFVNLHGFEAAGRNGASHLAFERNAAGFDLKVLFFNGTGQPATNGEGVYGYKIERDANGRVVQVINLSQDGQPAVNRFGFAAFSQIWNPAGLLIRQEVRDAAGRPAAADGVAALVSEYDASGNLARMTKLDLNGQRTSGDPPSWAEEQIMANERGETVGRKFFKIATDGALEMLREITLSYDEYGHPAEIRSTGTSTSRSAQRHDAKGNLTEETFLDAEGRPTPGEPGYAIKRLTYTSGPQSFRIEQTFFDATGAKVFNLAGYHRVIDDYDITGVLRRQTLDEHDPAKFAYYRYVGEPEFDSQGRTRRLTTRYEDAQGQLVDAAKAGLTHNATEELFDEEKRPVTEWKLGCDVNSLGAPVLRTESEWHKTGARKRRTRQACDTARKPLAVISNGNAAHTEEENNEIDRLERIYESGFDETLVGFSTREAKFSNGIFQNVIHKRSDGTVIESVSVVIKAVLPQQPKAAELHAGDQLLEANGNPVHSSYEWAAANFAGGWIEVLRDGKRLRIEGFEAGLLGLVLEDHAPAVKR
jgi:predicted Ser/Thr protein kinase